MTGVQTCALPICIAQIVPPERWFLDLDRALEWAEDALLGQQRFEDAPELALRDVALLSGLNEDELATLSGSLPPRLKNLENFEAMSFGPPLADGRRTLLLLSDNNCSDTQVTALVVLAFSAPSTRR